MTSAHRNLPGFRRLADILASEPSETRPTIRTRTLDGFVGSLEDDLVSCFGRNHLRVLGNGRVLVRLDRIIRDDYDGNVDAFWNELEAAATPSAKKPSGPRPKEKLLAQLQNLPDNPARRTIAELVQADKGWVARVLRRDGHEEAVEQIRSVVVSAEHLRQPLPNPTTLKDFSSRLFQDSHRLDPGSSGHGRLADYLVTQPLIDVDTSDPDWRRRVFEHYNLFQNTMETTVFVGGDLRLAFAGSTDSRVAENTGRGLATCLTLDELAQCTIAEPKPRLVLSSENSSPFTNLIRRPVPGIALVYTAGYGNLAVSRLLTMLVSAGVPHYHWGDVDVTGLRVLHRFQLLTQAKPLFMDATAVTDCKRWLTPFKGNKRKHIEENRDRFAPPHRAALQTCLDLAGWLEQEPIPPNLVAERLRGLGDTAPSVNRK